MHTIEIDFDVFKALTARRSSADVSENDVLRQLLGLPSVNGLSRAPSAPANDDWVTKSVRFPVGTEFRSTHKGQTYLGRVDGGALLLRGKKYDTPSAAAMSITENAVNGWTFWEARLPGRAQWTTIKSLRKPSS